MAREQYLLRFLEKNNLKDVPISFLAGDASFRKYYRVTKAQNSLVIMDAPPPESPEKFIQIANLLYNNGFSVPKIEDFDLENGYVLIEDLGDQTYTKILNADTSYQKAQELYFLAIDTLIDMHKKITSKPDFIAPYLPEIHLQEAMLLIDWYYKAIYHQDLRVSAVNEFKFLWLSKLRQLNEKRAAPHTLVLRDFHVDNLMILDARTGTHRCGLLDFQDALWGSITYDIVSLLEDARRDVSENIAKDCWQRYLKAFPHLDPEKIREEAVILSAARHAKILGIFTRLAVRDGKISYLIHIPRIWRLLEQCLLHPSMADLKIWFDTYFQERSIPHV